MSIVARSAPPAGSTAWDAKRIACKRFGGLPKAGESSPPLASMKKPRLSGLFPSAQINAQDRADFTGRSVANAGTAGTPARKPTCRDRQYRAGNPARPDCGPQTRRLRCGDSGRRWQRSTPAVRWRPHGKQRARGVTQVCRRIAGQHCRTGDGVPSPGRAGRSGARSRHPGISGGRCAATASASLP